MESGDHGQHLPSVPSSCRRPAAPLYHSQSASSSFHHAPGPSLKVVLLHGNLDMWVHDARLLPNKDMLSKRVGNLLGARITGAVGSKMSGASMTSDPYVTVQVATATVARTYVVSNNENPVWDQHFLVPVGHQAADVQFVVKDNDVFGAQTIGAVSIPAEKLLSGDRIEGVYPVHDPNGKPCVCPYSSSTWLASQVTTMASLLVRTLVACLILTSHCVAA